MRMTFIVICVIIAAIIGLSVYTTSTLNESVDYLQQLTRQAQQAADAGDVVSCKHAAQELWNGWDERFTKLAALIPHDDLDKVSLSITGIWQKARYDQTGGLAADIGILGEHLDHLLHKEEFRWENLL